MMKITGVHPSVKQRQESASGSGCAAGPVCAKLGRLGGERRASQRAHIGDDDPRRIGTFWK